MKIRKSDEKLGNMKYTPLLKLGVFLQKLAKHCVFHTPVFLHCPRGEYIISDGSL